MKTANKFRDRITAERRSANHFDHRTFVVPSKLAYDLIKRVEQLENEFADIVGYIPGLPVDKAHLTYKEYFGI